MVCTGSCELHARLCVRVSVRILWCVYMYLHVCVCVCTLHASHIQTYILEIYNVYLVYNFIYIIYTHIQNALQEYVCVCVYHTRCMP